MTALLTMKNGMYIYTLTPSVISEVWYSMLSPRKPFQDFSGTSVHSFQKLCACVAAVVSNEMIVKQMVFCQQ